MKPDLQIAALLLAGVLTSAAQAQTLERPVHKVGEWCEYQNIYNHVSRHTVIEAGIDGRFTIRVSGPMVKAPLERVYNADQMLLRSGSIVFTPARLHATFPLTVGSPAGGGSFDYVGGLGPTRASLKITDVVRETVKVPAGTFDSVRVDSAMRYTREDGYSNSIVDRSWYALNGSVKRVLKYESNDYGATTGREMIELVRCGADSEGK
jgi:hypothetical protein